MELVLLLFPATVVLVAVATGLTILRHGRRGRVTQIWYSVLAGLAAAYLAGLGLVILDPWFDDNGVPTFIDWRFRWTWAAMYASLLEVVAVPLTVGGFLLYRRIMEHRAAPAGVVARQPGQ